jgi:hypothetical protein
MVAVPIGRRLPKRLKPRSSSGSCSAISSRKHQGARSCRRGTLRGPSASNTGHEISAATPQAPQRIRGLDIGDDVAASAWSRSWSPILWRSQQHGIDAACGPFDPRETEVHEREAITPRLTALKSEP